MNNILNFPSARPGQEKNTAKQIADHLFNILAEDHQDEAHARFWLANELMNLVEHVEYRKAFSLNEVIEHVIGDRPEVYAVAEKLVPDY